MMKRTTIVLVALMGILTLGGCKLTDHRQHDFQELLNSFVDENGEYTISDDDGNTYQKGPATLEAAQVRELSVNWLNDSVTIKAYDGNEVLVSETTDTLINDSTTLHYALTDDGELKVEFCKPGVKMKAHDLPQKHLLVMIPRTLHLDEVEVNGVSQNMLIESISCNRMELNSVSNYVTLNECRIDHLESNSVSTYDFMAVFSQLPKDIEWNSVGGSTTLCVPSDAGMTIDLAGVVTDLHSDLPVNRKGKKHVIGNGACEIELNSVSGELYIKEK